jgi:hypothetical protein
MMAAGCPEQKMMRNQNDKLAKRTLTQAFMWKSYGKPTEKSAANRQLS